MNNGNKIITTIFFSASAVFLGIAFFAWTVFPYLQMRSFFVGFKKAINGDASILRNNTFAFANMTYVQPELRYQFMDYLLNFYSDDKYAKEREELVSLLPIAIDKLSKSFSYEKNYAAHFLALGRGYDLMADLDPLRSKEFHGQAVLQFKKSLEIYPDNQRTLYAYAITIANEGDVDGAIAMMQKILARDPRIPESHYYLGTLLYMKDNFANSDTALEHITYSLDHGIEPALSLTKKIFEKMLVYYYAKQDISRFKIVVEKLSRYDNDQSLVYKKILSYIAEHNALPVINLKKPE